ncbi:DUF3502 domain-containing protein [Paenibacillus cymbidii]|uniref:DUF3502 domain-containing protein n=1 Tax=Paenibacillus cymbidii TaxID=1639034 RepID=UPI001082212B|nr:DUF3502 domain-containing protein [Paenibacillus cymbidii]
MNHRNGAFIGYAGKLVALAAVTGTLLAGCSGGKDKGSAASPSASPAASASASANPFAKQLEITWIGSSTPGKAFDKLDNPTKKAIEEKFNVKINQVVMDIFNKEQVNLYFADGKTADYIAVNPVEGRMLMDQGLLREIPEDKLRKLMPNWMKTIEGMLDPAIVKTTMMYKGKIYSVPQFNYASTQPWVMGIRKDWLDNVGISKMPETIEEYHEVLKRFTFNDPDKNGKNDTYGTHGYGVNGTQIYLRGAYGLGQPNYPVEAIGNSNFYADKDGKVAAMPISDNYKAYLKTMQAWIKEGIIDPESLTDQRPQQRAKWADGKFGVLADHPWWFAMSTVGGVTKMVTDKNPNAKIEFFKPFKGPDGSSGTSNITFPSVMFGFGFGKNTSDEKMERIMAIKDALVSDEKFYMQTYYGAEGKGYTRDADGIVKVAADYLVVDKVISEGIGGFYGLRPVNWDFAKKNLIYKTDMPAYDVAMAAPIKYSNVNFTFSGTNEALAKNGTAVATVVTEFETNAIGGKLDIDKEWEAYKKKYLDAGGKAILDEYQKLYDASNKK